MAQFLGDIAFLLELVVVAAGLVLLHRGRQAGAGLLRLAALLLIVGGIGTALCTTYFWCNYHGRGDFRSAYGMSPMHAMMHGGMMGRHGGSWAHKGMMHGGMMHGEMMGGPCSEMMPGCKGAPCPGAMMSPPEEGPSPEASPPPEKD